MAISLNSQFALSTGSALLIFAVKGCHTPNVQPFADATLDLNAAVRTGYRTTWAGLESYAALDKDTGQPIARSTTNHPAARFLIQMTNRLAVFDAMAAYSESLAHIVQSGDESRANAKAISEQVTKLTAATPWAAYGELGTSLFQEAHNLAVSVAQYHALSEAVNKADEVVQRSAGAIHKDVGSLGRMLASLYEDQEEAIITKYNHHRAIITDLIARREALENKVTALHRSVEDRRYQLLAVRLEIETDPARLEQHREALSKIQVKLASAEEDLKLVLIALKESDGLMSRMADTQQAFESEQAALNERRRVSLQLTVVTEEAIRQWAAAHRDLKSAIEQQREPNMQLLVSSALEVRAIVKKWNDL